MHVLLRDSTTVVVPLSILEEINRKLDRIPIIEKELKEIKKINKKLQENVERSHISEKRNEDPFGRIENETYELKSVSDSQKRLETLANQLLEYNKAELRKLANCQKSSTGNVLNEQEDLKELMVNNHNQYMVDLASSKKLLDETKKVYMESLVEEYRSDKVEQRRRMEAERRNFGTSTAVASRGRQRKRRSQ